MKLKFPMVMGVAMVCACVLSGCACNSYDRSATSRTVLTRPAGPPDPTPNRPKVAAEWKFGNRTYADRNGDGVVDYFWEAEEGVLDAPVLEREDTDFDGSFDLERHSAGLNDQASYEQRINMPVPPIQRFHRPTRTYSLKGSGAEQPSAADVGDAAAEE